MERTGPFCSEQSRQVSEELWGTATRVDTWLLLEYTGPWGRKAFEESSLPQPIKGWLTEHLNLLPNARLELIKQGAAGSGITFFVGVAHESKPALYEFGLAAYEDLLTLDLAAILSGAATYRGSLREAPLYLVCTNGKRDLCCARRGVPVYQAMARRAGRSAWECTHLGGHRFAATAVFLPHAVCYGRVQESDVEGLVDAYEKGRISLPRYRGRSCYDEVVQAADSLLRAETGIDGLAHFRLQETRVLGADRWAVRFVDAAESAHTVQLARESTGVVRIESCRESTPTEVNRYRLIDYQATDDGCGG